MTITFNTREYRREHGREPKGRGFWGFSFEGYEFWSLGTLTEARKACRQEVRRLAPEGYTGFVEVKVLP